MAIVHKQMDCLRPLLQDSLLHIGSGMLGAAERNQVILQGAPGTEDMVLGNLTEYLEPALKVATEMVTARLKASINDLKYGI